VFNQRLKNSMSLLAGLLLCVLLASCGWHLRGSIDLPDEMRRVYLQAEAINVDLRRDIELAFELNGVELTPADQAAYSVQLMSVTEDRRVSSLGTDGVADSISLSLIANYAISDAKGTVVIPEGPAKVTRSFNFDRDNVAAKEQEEQTIARELRQELAQQILRSFRYALRNRSESGATEETSGPETPTVIEQELDEQAAPGTTE